MTELPAGPELDAAIAEQVMGWEKWEAAGRRLWRIPKGAGGGHNHGRPWAVNAYEGGEPYGDEWSPSHHITAAWAVVDRMREKGCKSFRLHMVDLKDDEGPWYWAMFSKRPWSPNAGMETGHSGEEWAVELTAPLAICQAALDAVPTPVSTPE